METLIAVAIEIIVQAGFLWGGMKLLKVNSTVPKILGVAAIPSVLGFLPVYGFLVGTVVMFLLIRQWTDADIWPDTIVLVVIAAISRLLVALVIAGVIAGAS